jgi:sucrose phosphorylase
MKKVIEAGHEYNGDILHLLHSLYGREKGDAAHRKITDLIRHHKIKESREEELFSEKDIVLVTYGDSLNRENETEKPLTTLYRFAGSRLKDIISTIHILPCFPYSSDDGFSVIDYASINPGLGSWDEVRTLAGEFKLMLDLVLNHISTQNPWFRKYLGGEEGFRDLVIEVDPTADLSMVVRPRLSPLITAFQKNNHEAVYLWTTFSADQVDLNFKSIDVLLKMVEILLLYAGAGASIIRLDAVAYPWKEIGTDCINLPQTHALVKLLRKIFNSVRRKGIIITETNVPHAENISYFGSGHDEAQMVYNFALPPLLVYTFMKEDTGILSRWARTLAAPSAETTFFNFTASHDGIGVRPLEGIIPPGELAKMIEMVKKNGGMVSYHRNADGSENPYELNITYVDVFLRKDGHGRDPLHVRRFLASQAIQLVLPGVPAIYIHSLLGSHNWVEGVAQTGRARTINREKLNPDRVTAELADPDSFRHRVFTGYTHMLKIRRDQPAFHPNAPFEIPFIDSRVFLVIRKSGTQIIYAFTNVSPQFLQVNLKANHIPVGTIDLLGGERVTSDVLELSPYDVVWLSHGGESLLHSPGEV